MSIKLSTSTKNAMGDAITSLIDSGSLFASGFIQIRSGVRPTSVDDPASGEVLATCFLSSPSFGPFSNGIGVANQIGQDTNLAATGVGTWFRLYNRNGEAIMDGDVGVNGSGSEIMLNSVNFIQGGVLTIANFTLSVPG